MKLTNNFIFRYTEGLHEIVNDDNLKFNAQVNYIIQKNFKNLLTLYQELDEVRLKICEAYSTSRSEEGYYVFEDDEKRKKAETELNDLMISSQEVNIMKFKITALGDTELTSKQMDILMFMIEDEDGGQE